MHKNIAVLFLLASIAGVASASSWSENEPKQKMKLPLIQQKKPATRPTVIKKVRLLPDSFAMAGADVTLSKSAVRDIWVFTLNSPVTDGKVLIKPGIMMEALPSNTLEKMIAAMKDANSAEFRIWARVTQYESRNFVLPMYFLTVNKEQAADTNVPAEPNNTPIITNEPNDTIVIPQDVLDMLKPKRTVDLARLSMPSAAIEEDAIFSDRTGFIKKDAMGDYVFVPDALGRNVQNISFTILPNQELKNTIKIQDAEPDRVRFKISGVLTKFDGRYYILLQRALRQFNYGNFAR